MPGWEAGHFYFKIIGNLRITRNKKPQLIITEVFKRSRADSNRCTRFCRPMPKPLGHETLWAANVIK